MDLFRVSSLGLFANLCHLFGRTKGQFLRVGALLLSALRAQRRPPFSVLRGDRNSAFKILPELGFSNSRPSLPACPLSETGVKGSFELLDPVGVVSPFSHLETFSKRLERDAPSICETQACARFRPKTSSTTLREPSPLEASVVDWWSSKKKS